MNYGLMLSCRVEDKLAQFQRSDSWDQNDEAASYETALREALEEIPGSWADGNIRLGDYIILSMLPHSDH
jgi:hypothetical protein